MAEAYTPHPNIAPILQRIDQLQDDRSIPARNRKPELVNATKASYPAIASWYSGSTMSIDTVHLVSIARYYGVTLDWLVTGEGDGPEWQNIGPEWAQRARVLMKNLSLTQDDLLPTFSVTTRDAVGHYFRGRREPTVDQVNSLALKLGVTIDYLVNGAGESRGSQERMELLHVIKSLNHKYVSCAKTMILALSELKDGK